MSSTIAMERVRRMVGHLATHPVTNNHDDSNCSKSKRHKTSAAGSPVAAANNKKSAAASGAKQDRLLDPKSLADLTTDLGGYWSALVLLAICLAYDTYPPPFRLLQAESTNKSVPASC